MAQRAILWDFDGTLAYRNGMWSGCLAEVLETHEPGKGFTRDSVRPFLQNGFPWHVPDGAHPHLDTPEAWWKEVENVLYGACIQVGIDEDKTLLYAREAHASYIDVAGFQLFDDTLPVLTSLAEAGWRNVIVSNHVPELISLVEGLELAHLVDEVLTSAVTGYEKPHPKMFALGREAAGNPDELWMVGDNAYADVAGAEAVGIPAVLVRTSHPEVERSATDLADAQRRYFSARASGLRRGGL